MCIIGCKDSAFQGWGFGLHVGTCFVQEGTPEMRSLRLRLTRVPSKAQQSWEQLNPAVSGDSAIGARSGVGEGGRGRYFLKALLGPCYGH